MNGGWNGGNGHAMDPLVPERLAEIQRPACTFTFMDEDASSMTSREFFFDPGYALFWYMIPGCRDRGCGANVAFADAHIFFKKWQCLGRTRNGATVPVQKNAPDAADLLWVQRAGMGVSGQ